MTARTKPTALFLAGLALLLISSTGAMAQVGKNMGVLNPNTASAEELAALPGLNPDLAGRIAAGRPYLNMEALDKALAPALSTGQRKALYVRLFLPINLNTASVDAIRMVPGVGRRMTGSSANTGRTAGSRSSGARSASMSTTRRWPASNNTCSCPSS